MLKRDVFCGPVSVTVKGNGREYYALYRYLLEDTTHLLIGGTTGSEKA